MMFKWFKDCKTLEDVKSEYKKLCRKYHPDMGGSLEAMQEINAEFERAFAAYKDIHKAEDGTTYNKETTETPEQFKDIINTLVTCEGLTVSIIGCWLWAEGETYRYKEVLKKLGFRYANTKKAWYYHRAEDTCRSRKKQSLEEIKSKYGCTTYAGTSLKALATA